MIWYISVYVWLKIKKQNKTENRSWPGYDDTGDLVPGPIVLLVVGITMNDH